MAVNFMGKKVKIAALTVLIALATGCGQANTAAEVPSSSPSASSTNANLAAAGPIELSVYQTSANISDEEFARLMVEPVKRKYPNITLQLIHTAPDKKPEQLVASDTLPDLIFGSQISIEVLSDLGAVLDLTEYGELIRELTEMLFEHWDPELIKQTFYEKNPDLKYVARWGQTVGFGRMDLWDSSDAKQQPN